MHEMRTIAIDDPGVCQSVCHVLGCTKLRCSNTAERIEIVLRGENSCGPTEHETASPQIRYGLRYIT